MLQLPESSRNTGFSLCLLLKEQAETCVSWPENFCAGKTLFFSMKELYVRFLPHWHPQDKWIFITWRLAGSQPRNPAILRPDLPEGKRFALLDREADRATTGPLWLSDPRIAQVVQDKIIAGAPSLFDLAAWAIMANHVHIVILPKCPSQRF